VLAEEVPEVAVEGVLHHDEQRPVLGAAAEQVDDVDVLADHFHHFHFGHQVHHFRIRVTLWNTKPLRYSRKKWTTIFLKYIFQYNKSSHIFLIGSYVDMKLFKK